MSDASLPASPPRLSSMSHRRFGLGVLALLGLAALAGAAIGHQPLLALLAVAFTGCVLATPFVETLAVLTFWLLPYLILNLPTGGVTLKVPEVTAYLFATAALARALLRREPISLPPATPQVLFYLAVLAISAALEPGIPSIYSYLYNGVQGPELRSAMMLFWLILSWLVVVGLYHVVGTDRNLYWRCVRGHILGGGLASLIGITGYVMTLLGYDLALGSVGHAHSFIYTGGSSYRLTGVSYEPLLFAFYLVTVIPATLAVVLFHRNWMPRWLALTALILQSAALLLTFSSGGWAALAAALLLLAWLLRPRRWDWTIVLSILRASLLPILLIVLAVTFFITNPMTSHTAGYAFSKLVSGGYQTRDQENQTGLRIFNAHVWLGVGPGMVPFHFLAYHPTARTLGDAQSMDIAIYVNNLYIATLAETGIIGFAALALCGIAGAAALGRALQKRGPLQVPVLSALTVSLVACAIQYWETENLFLIYFPVLVGLAVAGVRLAQTEAEQPCHGMSQAPQGMQSRPPAPLEAPSLLLEQPTRRF